MKKQYMEPEIYVDEYEIDNTLGNLCDVSGVADAPEVYPGWPGPQEEE